MNTSELRQMKYRNLVDLRERLDEVIEEKAKDEKLRVRSIVSKVAEDNGFKLNDLVGSKMKAGFAKRHGPTNHVAPKYRNPLDPSQTWTGRGRAPRWYDKNQAQSA